MPIDLSSITGQAKDYLQSDDFKQIAPYLISGGAGALLGGIMTGRRRERSGEGRLGYLGRILRNALITGGLGAGAHYLLGRGWDNTFGALNKEKALTGGAADQGPASSLVRNVAFSPATAIGAGATGLALTDKLPFIGADRGGQKDALKSLGSRLSASDEVLRAASPSEIKGMLTGAAGGNADRLKVLERLRRRAGLASTSSIDLGPINKDFKGKPKGALSWLARKPGSTFGQTWGRRAGRGAVGLAAAGIPALIGAMLTNEAN